MTTDIFIVSYLKDIEYLKYCLNSIWKFATGFNQVVLLVPQDEESNFRQFQSGVKLETYQRVSDPAKWHLDSQAQKCLADGYSDADFIFFTDSDCVFTEPVTPKDYFFDGKPVLLIESFSRIPDSPWKPTTDRALKMDAQYETMRRHGAVHYRGLLYDAQIRMQSLHGIPLRDYFLSCKPDFPWGVSEFNLLGNYALTSEWKSKYHFIDIGVSPVPHPKIFQAWSYSPLDKLQDLPSGGRATPLELYQKLGL